MKIYIIVSENSHYSREIESVWGIDDLANMECARLNEKYSSMGMRYKVVARILNQEFGGS